MKVDISEKILVFLQIFNETDCLLFSILLHIFRCKELIKFVMNSKWLSFENILKNAEHEKYSAEKQEG